MDEERAKMIILGCCTLHNIFCEINEEGYIYNVDKEDVTAGLFTHGRWRNEMARNTYTQLRNLTGGRPTAEAGKKREYLMEYFNSPVGMVAWQDRMIARQDEDSDEEM